MVQRVKMMIWKWRWWWYWRWQGNLFGRSTKSRPDFNIPCATQLWRLWRRPLGTKTPKLNSGKLFRGGQLEQLPNIHCSRQEPSWKRAIQSLKWKQHLPKYISWKHANVKGPSSFTKYRAGRPAIYGDIFSWESWLFVSICPLLFASTTWKKASIQFFTYWCFGWCWLVALLDWLLTT